MQLATMRMVVTDLDGTLLDTNREISDRAVDTIGMLYRKNIPFAFITGRPPYAVERFAQRVGITSPIACCNGAIIMQGGQVLSQHSFPIEPLRGMMERAAARGLTVLLYTQGTEYTLAETDWTRSRQAAGKQFQIWRFDDHADAEVIKVNVIVEDCQRADFVTLTPEVCALQNEYSVALFGQNGCEIVSGEVNKATAMRELCRLCGVPPEQTLAIGDNENDNPMILAAGIGAAVANAVHSTRALADYQCVLGYTDGVLEAIEKFVLGDISL